MPTESQVTDGAAYSPSVGLVMTLAGYNSGMTKWNQFEEI